MSCRHNGKEWISWGFIANSVTFGPDDMILAGTSTGVFRYDGDSWEPVYEIPLGSAKSVRSLAVASDGAVWALMQDAGVGRYDGEEWEIHTLNDVLENSVLNSIAIDPDGVVWVGTEEGLYRYGETPIFVETSEILPSEIDIKGNFPNPFNPSTAIRFALPHEGTVQLSIYNIMGQRVRTLIDASMIAGIHRVQWDGKDDQSLEMSTGIYFLRLMMGDMMATHRMVLIK
ncbi:MAG TPA: T9SS type A sorting domain-containing protein [bacterium]|nr:T9SS type A sorting domain-containing protein [bacterium]